MALSLDDLTAKVDNGGVTPDGLLTAEEYNTLLAAVKENAENSTDEHIGSVVVDNTLSAVKADSNKPVSSSAVAKELAERDTTIKKLNEEGRLYSISGTSSIYGDSFEINGKLWWIDKDTRTWRSTNTLTLSLKYPTTSTCFIVHDTVNNTIALRNANNNLLSSDIILFQHAGESDGNVITAGALALDKYTLDKLTAEGANEFADIRAKLNEIGGIYLPLKGDEVVGFVDGNGIFYINAQAAHSVVLPLKGLKKIKFTTDSDGNYVSFLSAPVVGGEKVQFSSRAKSRIFLSEGNTDYYFDLNNDDLYFVTQTISAGNIPIEFGLLGYGGAVAELASEIENRSYLGTHLLPENDTQEAIVRRARQMTDIEWTPAFDIPRFSWCADDNDVLYESTHSGAFEDVFKAGKTYKGLPYCRGDQTASQWGYGTFKIGIEVSFETFITSVMNKRTTAEMDSEFSKTANQACVYGTVCSSLTSYALGLNTFVATQGIPSIAGIVDMGLLSEFDLLNLRLGDVLNLYAIHTSIVTDVIIEGGIVKYVELSESVPNGNENNAVLGTDEEGGELGGVCRRLWWTVEKLIEQWGTYTVFRYTKPVSYTPSPYVQTGGEMPSYAPHKMACLPYMGNGFVYKSGHIVNSNILIIAKGFDKLRVVKDGVNWNSDGQGGYYDIAGKEQIEVGFTEVGEYTAYLCNVLNGVETKKSKTCKWIVN